MAPPEKKRDEEAQSPQPADPPLAPPEAASENMSAEATLSRLDEADADTSKRIPPGRQLTGEPPARRVS